MRLYTLKIAPGEVFELAAVGDYVRVRSSAVDLNIEQPDSNEQILVGDGEPVINGGRTGVYPCSHAVIPFFCNAARPSRRRRWLPRRTTAMRPPSGCPARHRRRRPCRLPSRRY